MPKIIQFTHQGDFAKTSKLFHRLTELRYAGKLRIYGERGVKALSAATPNESGETAGAWSYEIEEQSGSVSIYWRNSNVNKDVNIAIILQYGHGTRNGGYVEGIDYINPAMRPLFQEMANEVWKEVVSS